jgi:hypothetical protein
MRRWGFLALSVAALTLVLVGALSLGGFWFLHKQPFDVPEWQDAHTLVDASRIDPALAMAGLGGVSDGELVTQALASARPDTALAILVFSPSIGDRESAGNFLLLAQRYRNSNQPRLAVVAYRLAGTIATLSPDLPDTVRADTFVLAGKGLADSGEFGLAQLYFDQAYNVVKVSRHIQPVTRRSLLQRLHEGYLAIGDREPAKASLEKSAAEFDLVVVPEAPPALPVAQPPPLPQDVQRAEATRWQAAQALAALLVERGGRAPRQSIDELTNALVADDQLRLPYFNGQLAETQQLSSQINIVQARIDWLAIKYRVARRGYGISLVPEWESQAEQIRSDLTKSYELLFALYADLVVAMPEAGQIQLATEEMLRREILDGTLGRYPNYPADQRISELLQATARLVKSAPGAEMRVAVQPYGGVGSLVLVDDASFLSITGETP